MSKILIIGGGVSGLSAGIYAQLQGYEAIICERHNIAGGNLTGWDRGGYHIDNCVHWLTGTNPNTKFYKMWEDLGAVGDVEIFKGESLYTCEYDGQRLSLSRDIQKFEKDMLSISPGDKREIRSFIRAIEVFQGLFDIGGKEHNEKVRLGAALRSAPALIRYYNMTIGELSNRFKHPLLRFFMRAFWGENFGAFTLIYVFANFCGENGDIPKGGSTAMAERMVERFISLGGTLLLRKEAVKVEIDNGKARSVIFADGTSIEADYVVITGDPTKAFGGYLDIPMPKKLKSFYDDSRMIRFSSYHCAFACDSETLPFEGDYIFEVPEKYSSILNTKRMIIREFSHENTFAPKGKNLIQTLTYVYEDDAKEFIDLKNRRRDEYRAKKKELSELICRIIEEQLPMLKDKLTCIDVWTPSTYNRFTDTEIGSWMGFALPSKKFPSRIENTVEGLSNVILATQWLQPPGGLPIAAEGGKIAIQTIDELEKIK